MKKLIFIMMIGLFVISGCSMPNTDVYLAAEETTTTQPTNPGNNNPPQTPPTTGGNNGGNETPQQPPVTQPEDDGNDDETTQEATDNAENENDDDNETTNPDDGDNNNNESSENETSEEPTNNPSEENENGETSTSTETQTPVDDTSSETNTNSNSTTTEQQIRYFVPINYLWDIEYTNADVAYSSVIGHVEYPTIDDVKNYLTSTYASRAANSSEFSLLVGLLQNPGILVKDGNTVKLLKSEKAIDDSGEVTTPTRTSDLNEYKAHLNYATIPSNYGNLIHSNGTEGDNIICEMPRIVIGVVGSTHTIDEICHTVTIQ